MKKMVFVLVFATLVAAAFANSLTVHIKMGEKCKNVYTDDPSAETIITDFLQTDELRDKVAAIAHHYFPDQDLSQLILVGWDSDGSLNDRHCYAFTLSGSVHYSTGDAYGKMIHLSRQNLPGGVNDENFEWVIVHELIHVFNESDVTHTNPDCIKMAEQVQATYGINPRYW